MQKKKKPNYTIPFNSLTCRFVNNTCSTVAWLGDYSVFVRVFFSSYLKHFKFSRTAYVFLSVVPGMTYMIYEPFLCPTPDSVDDWLSTRERFTVCKLRVLEWLCGASRLCCMSCTDYRQHVLQYVHVACPAYCVRVIGVMDVLVHL